MCCEEQESGNESASNRCHREDLDPGDERSSLWQRDDEDRDDRKDRQTVGHTLEEDRRQGPEAGYPERPGREHRPRDIAEPGRQESVSEVADAEVGESRTIWHARKRVQDAPPTDGSNCHLEGGQAEGANQGERRDVAEGPACGG